MILNFSDIPNLNCNILFQYLYKKKLHTSLSTSYTFSIDFSTGPIQGQEGP